jgi:hypothetical protein
MYYLCGGFLLDGWRQLRVWGRHFWSYVTGHTGYRVVIGVPVTFVTFYTALYAIAEARYERRMNRALYERAAFMDMVTSGKPGTFVAAMKEFGRIQTMIVPPEPEITNPIAWFAYRTDHPDAYPNRKPLWRWARHAFGTCTKAACTTDPAGRWRIDLREADLAGAILGRADLREADLRGAILREATMFWTDLREAILVGADLHGAVLYNADLRGAFLAWADLTEAYLGGAYLRGAVMRGAFLFGADLRETKNWTPELLQQAYWDTTTKWPDETRWPGSYTPPCPQNLPDKPCEP